MIQLSGAGKRFGHKLLFENADWLITTHDRIGLVGGNGTGKSTLLKILGGMESLRLRLAHRRQGHLRRLSAAGWPYALRTHGVCRVHVGVRRPARHGEGTGSAHAQHGRTRPHQPGICRRRRPLPARRHEFRTRDGYAIEAQVGSVLTGLGFRKEDWQRRTEEFSGGWQMRIALAKLLLEKPNLLLLDEPTNHLDLEARNWLEEYLTNYPNAFVLISHDRYFLDVTVNKIVEIWNKRPFYTGNYDKYLRRRRSARAIDGGLPNQRERIEQLEAFINRFRDQATKAKQVQSRIKELEKIERIEIPPEEKTIHFSFPQPKPSGRIVAEFKTSPRAIGTAKQTKKSSAMSIFMIERGDRIALVGVNGAGKSTLIKLLAGTEPVTSAANIARAQRRCRLLRAGSIQGTRPRRAHARRSRRRLARLDAKPNCAACWDAFLFSDDDVFKRIGVLSGGERNRYALPRMLLHPANFLLLDEPTNHLDMRAKDVLLEALKKYTGTVVFVSHDRYFIDKLATRVFEIGDGKVEIFPGNYEDYLWRKQGGQHVAPTLDDVPGVKTDTKKSQGAPFLRRSSEKWGFQRDG